MHNFGIGIDSPVKLLSFTKTSPQINNESHGINILFLQMNTSPGNKSQESKTINLPSLQTSIFIQIFANFLNLFNQYLKSIQLTIVLITETKIMTIANKPQPYTIQIAHEIYQKMKNISVKTCSKYSNSYGIGICILHNPYFSFLYKIFSFLFSNPFLCFQYNSSKVQFSTSLQQTGINPQFYSSYSYFKCLFSNPKLLFLYVFFLRISYV
ncbi:hypothetical protein IMG5_160800 [Ichthyophthirius multifiliis]|uniref:Uncharacterized protein n=1 Tax=Ichthyophthirius multifiliis TaxID=5932 RepID=G0QZZ1_ICHMU|nr:hypothetical protein IMG5_160800 [Ichthyophthirius multifiliis]EGR29201.1 hypothetical protein IMG5_160800 [Ichthyophthirius multifiliis]|eukprot:XP_004030437.1 hypothetical protein IMG5_160800 [Ichthyophthirius multifiliis]